MADLSGIREKIKRAEEHIAELEGLTTTLQNSCTHSVSVKFDPDTHTCTHCISGDPPDIPIKFNVVIGETIHQLRQVVGWIIGEFESRFF